MPIAIHLPNGHTQTVRNVLDHEPHAWTAQARHPFGMRTMAIDPGESASSRPQPVAKRSAPRYALAF